MYRLLLATAMLLIISSSTYSQFSSPQFHDNFEDGSAVDGDPAMWVLDTIPGPKNDPRLFVSGGRYVLAPVDPHLLASRINDYPLNDFSIRAQFRLVGEPGGTTFVGVSGRSTGTGVDNYWAGFGTDGRIYSGIQQAQNPATLRSDAHSFDLFDQDVVLQMDFVGTRVRAKFWQAGIEERAQQLEFENDSLLKGDVLGLWINPLDNTVLAAFEFVEVTPVIDRFDFDDSGELDVNDMDEMATQIVTGAFDSLFDLDYDATVDQHDAGNWLHDAAIVNGFAETYVDGDANLDGTVNAADLNALAIHWLKAEAAWSGGDFDFSGVTDAVDLNALALNWQKSVPLAETMVSMPIPEPSCLTLILGAMMAILLRRGN